MPTRIPLVAFTTAATLLLAGCNAADTTDHATPGSENSAQPDGVTVAAAFYPLQFVTERVAGELASVTSLTAPGVEAHDLELSPSAVREMHNVDVVVFLSGFQPAVDSAVETSGVRALDAHRLVQEHESAHDDHEHDDDGHGHAHASGDPHFWLDPSLMAELATDVAHELSDIDPENADTYSANADSLVSELLALDAAFEDGLSQCERRDIFVSHEAFGYLTERFHLEQHGLAGLDPDTEPSPARVREVRDAVIDSGATHVYSESEVGAAGIEALASDAGVATAVLDPVETVTGDDDYIGVMTRNLESLRAGLGCG